jgi:hypothetical protein
MPKRVGETYLAVDPAETSGSVVDLHRVWATRIPVVVVKVHVFRARNRYDVRGLDGREWSTGRLEELKPVRYRVCA